MFSRRQWRTKEWKKLRGQRNMGGNKRAEDRIYANTWRQKKVCFKVTIQRRELNVMEGKG